MRNLQFYVSDKRPMDLVVADDLTPKVHPNRLYCLSYSQTLQSVLYQQYFSINYVNIKNFPRHVYTQCLISSNDTIPIVYDQCDVTLRTAWMTQQHYQYQTLTFKKKIQRNHSAQTHDNQLPADIHFSIEFCQSIIDCWEIISNYTILLLREWPKTYHLSRKV